MLSLMLTIRKNSKFFPKFMAGFLLHTKNFANVELIVLASSEDTWNRDLFELYKDKLTVYYEDFRCGKNGRHLFYNELAQYAKGDWLWHMCDDHYLLDGYDEYLVSYINDNHIDANKVNIIVPRVENSGSIAHLLSRSWYEAAGRIGSHGNIDSYLNGVVDRMIHKRDHHPDKPVLWDYTTDPTIMTPLHSEITLNPEFKHYAFTSDETKHEMDIDAHRLHIAIEGGK